MPQRTSKGRIYRRVDREKRPTRGDRLSQAEGTRVSLHRKWLCTKEISIPLPWNSNESLASASVVPQGAINFSPLLNPPAGRLRIYRRPGTISRRLDYCRNTSDRLPTKLFFIQTRLKKENRNFFRKFGTVPSVCFMQKYLSKNLRSSKKARGFA